MYRHIRLDKNEPFYIGIGSDKVYKRAKEKSRRNKVWNDIVLKTDFEVEIILDNLTWEEAKLKEKEFISLYGRKDYGTGSLANLTDGGDGAVGFIVDEIGKMRSSRVHKNKKVSIETRKKISQSLRCLQKSPDFIKNFVKESIKYSKSIRKKVLCKDTGTIFESASEAASFYGVSRTYICRQITGIRKNKLNLTYL